MRPAAPGVGLVTIQMDHAAIITVFALALARAVPLLCMVVVAHHNNRHILKHLVNTPLPE